MSMEVWQTSDPGCERSWRLDLARQYINPARGERCSGRSLLLAGRDLPDGSLRTNIVFGNDRFGADNRAVRRQKPSFVTVSQFSR